MKRVYACYRGLYGEDFIRESVESIRPYCDKIFVFWSAVPLGNVKFVSYMGKKIIFPAKFDNYVDVVSGLALKDKDIHVSRFDAPDNNNQVTEMVNSRILPNFDAPDTVLFIEPDMVFRSDQIKDALVEFEDKKLSHASTSQVEIWKLKPCYRIPLRRRPSCTLFDLAQYNGKLPKTGRGGNAAGMTYLNAFNHNFGFCLLARSMYWKHLLAIAFSPLIGDSRPRKDWYEKVWLDWRPETNNSNLEISEGHGHLIPKAVPYDFHALPETILASRPNFFPEKG